MKRILILAMMAMLSPGLVACENVRTDIDSSLVSMKQDFGLSSPSASSVPTPRTGPMETIQGEATLTPAPLSLSSNPVQTALPLSPPDCPVVRIVSDLNQVHQFTHGDKPAPQENISSIWMRDVQDRCELTDDNTVAIDITLAFEGLIGPKGRLHADDNPGFSYPYFVATTSNDGSIIAKEVFAVTLSYDKDEKTRTKIEKVRQAIPVDGRDYKNYKILIGFQLNDQELAFNRTQTVPLIEPAAGIP